MWLKYLIKEVFNFFLEILLSWLRVIWFFFKKSLIIKLNLKKIFIKELL